MQLDYLPLLKIHRDLQGLPRGMERFRHYLKVMLKQDRSDVEFPPLVMVNPMAKDHVTALLDTLLAMDADGIAARAAAEASAGLKSEPGQFKCSIVVADDLLGGWTNRYASEFGHRFKSDPRGKRFWVTGVLWSSETPSQEKVRDAVLTAAFRAAYIQIHGLAQNLRDMIAQEGQVLARAGCTQPSLDADDIAYTRDVLKSELEATDMRTAIECLFGDDAGHTLGFSPRGLSPFAGLALALHDARAKKELW